MLAQPPLGLIASGGAAWTGAVGPGTDSLTLDGADRSPPSTFSTYHREFQ